ncbi:MAG: pilus assembly PilX family protein [Panacagrimonas sp.]
MKPNSQRRQRGAALLVALIFLVLLTLIGLAAMGTNRMQQREANLASEQTLAFQYAETAAADGEKWIEAQTVQPVHGCEDEGPCTRSLSILNGGPASLAVFGALRRNTFWEQHGRLYGHYFEPGKVSVPIENLIPPRLPGQSPDVEDEQRLPRYVIEHLGKDPTASLVPGSSPYTLWYYRVTARGTGVQPDPPAIVQTVYVKGY